MGYLAFFLRTLETGKQDTLQVAKKGLGWVGVTAEIRPHTNVSSQTLRGWFLIDVEGQVSDICYFISVDNLISTDIIHLPPLTNN